MKKWKEYPEYTNSGGVFHFHGRLVLPRGGLDPRNKTTDYIEFSYYITSTSHL